MIVYTEEELEAIEDLRERLSDLDLDEEQSLPANLIRWLRARDMNVAKAEEMFRKSLEWRIETKVDSIMEWTPPAVFDKVFPSEICGFDSEGCPIIIIPLKFYDNQIYWSADKQEHFFYAVQKTEKLFELMRSRGETTRQAICIYDFEGFNLRNVMSRKYFEMNSEMTTILESNYPELGKAFYIVNAPRLFTFFWAMLKPFLPTKTASKVRIFGYNKDEWTEELLKNIPADQLPPTYGGTNEEFENTAFVNCGLENSER